MNADTSTSASTPIEKQATVASNPNGSLNGDIIPAALGGNKRKRGRPRKVSLRSELFEEMARSDPASVTEELAGIKRICEGRYVRDAEQYVTRDIVFCELIKLAFVPGVLLNYKMAALNKLIEMRGFNEPVREEVVSVAAVSRQWAKAPCQEDQKNQQHMDVIEQAR